MRVPVRPTVLPRINLDGTAVQMRCLTVPKFRLLYCDLLMHGILGLRKTGQMNSVLIDLMFLVFEFYCTTSFSFFLERFATMVEISTTAASLSASSVVIRTPI